jgi:polysaccharide biosynthesis protein PslJ
MRAGDPVPARRRGCHNGGNRVISTCGRADGTSGQRLVPFRAEVAFLSPKHPSGSDTRLSQVEALAPAAEVRRNLAKGPWDATTLLTVYIVLVFVVPSGFVVEFLGAAGRPSLLLGALGFFWWAQDRITREGRIAVGFQPVRLLALFFLAAILVNHVAAFLRPIDGLEGRGADRGIIVALGLVGLLLLAADCIKSRARLDTLLRRIATGASIVAAVGILQFFTGYDLAGTLRFPGLAELSGSGFVEIQDRSDLNRVAATASHPIEFGVVLGLVFPIALHYALFAKTRRKLAWLRVALIAIAIPMAISRSGTLTLAITFLAMWFSWPGRLRLRSAIITVAGALAMRTVIPGLLGTIKALFTNFWYDPSVHGRTDDYSEVGAYIANPPILGRGFMTFIPERYFVLDNQYLLFWIETGILGTAAFLLLFLGGFAVGRRARRGTDEETRSLGQALAGTCLATALVAATFDLLSFFMISGIAFLLVGCAGALWRFTREQPSGEVEAPEDPGEPSVSRLHPAHGRA